MAIYRRIVVCFFFLNFFFPISYLISYFSLRLTKTGKR